MEIKTYKQLEKAWDALVKQISDQSSFSDISESAKEDRRNKSKEDKLFFAKTYFPEYFRSEFSSFHHKWPEISIIKNEPVLITAMRGAGKSTFFNLMDTIHAICFGLSKYTILGGYTEIHAQLFSSRVLLELLYNPRLESDFGKFFRTNQMPSKSFFIAESKVFKTKTVVQAISIRQNCRGLVYGAYRPDRAVLDDIQTVKQSKSPLFVNETLNWIFTDLIPALASKHTLIILATYLHTKCVASILKNGGTVLEETFNPIKSFEFPAQKNASINGESTWKEEFPLKRLKSLLKTMGTKRYQQEYLLIPKSFEGDVFSEEWIQEYDRSKFHPSQYDLVLTWIDPATAERDKSCKKVVLTIGTIKNKIHVLEAWIKNQSVNKMIDAAFLQYQKYGSYQVIYEDNGGQALLNNVFQLNFDKRGFSIPIQPHHETMNKLLRIEETLSADIENGNILFDKKNSDQIELINELILFPNSYLDGPDALAGAVKKIKKIQITRFNRVRMGQKRKSSSWKNTY